MDQLGGEGTLELAIIDDAVSENQPIDVFYITFIFYKYNYKY